MNTLNIEVQDILDAIAMGQEPPHISMAVEHLAAGGNVSITQGSDHVGNASTIDELEQLLKLPRLPKLPSPRSVYCAGLLASPIGVQVLAAVKIAKDQGRIRDMGHCKELARNANAFATFLTLDPLVGQITEDTGSCACEAIF